MGESIICIGRKSCGRGEIGEKLADRLDIPCYGMMLSGGTWDIGAVWQMCLEHRYSLVACHRSRLR